LNNQKYKILKKK